MAQKKKLQVFVSSTYTDLKTERQAAVEAILRAGHIPAGMELFTAGDKSQMAVIHRWIDESDVYLLLLGGRYGSVEASTGKSYTHLEFEYAVKAGKPYFVLVMDEQHLKQRVKDVGLDVYETDNPEKYKDFRKLVTTDLLVHFWSDLKDIKLSTMQTLSDFDQRTDLVGWIPGSEATNSGEIAEQLARLTKENAELRVQATQVPKDLSTYNGLSFTEAYNFIDREVLSQEKFDPSYWVAIEAITDTYQYLQTPSPTHFLVLWSIVAPKGSVNIIDDSYQLKIVSKLEEVHLVNEVTISQGDGSNQVVHTGEYYITSLGVRFLLRLKLEMDHERAQRAGEQLKSNKDGFYFNPFK
jgi:hypothetical protein